jgi:hypothetical protein
MGILSWLFARSIAKRFEPHVKAEEERRKKQWQEEYDAWAKDPACCRCGSKVDVIIKSLGGSESLIYQGKEAYCWRCDPYRGCLDPRMWANWESYPYKGNYYRSKEEFNSCKEWQRKQDESRLQSE